MSQGNEMIFVISGNDDGDTYLDQMGEAEFLKRMSEEYYGSRKVCEPGKLFRPGEETGLVVIRGRQIKPIPVDVVKSYKLPDREV
jgi:hypothetical protein